MRTKGIGPNNLGCKSSPLKMNETLVEGEKEVAESTGYVDYASEVKPFIENLKITKKEE